MIPSHQDEEIKAKLEKLKGKNVRYVDSYFHIVDYSYVPGRVFSLFTTEGQKDLPVGNMERIIENIVLLADQTPPRSLPAAIPMMYPGGREDKPYKKPQKHIPVAAISPELEKTREPELPTEPDNPNEATIQEMAKDFVKQSNANSKEVTRTIMDAMKAVAGKKMKAEEADAIAELAQAYTNEQLSMIRLFAALGGDNNPKKIESDSKK